jgi:CHAT domain-containing protein
MLDAEIARIQLSLISSPHTHLERSKSLRALDEAEAELEAAKFSQNRGTHIARPAPVPLSILQSSLSPDELLIEYVVSDKDSFAIAVTVRSARAYKVPKLTDLQTLVRGYTDEVMRPDALPEISRVQARRLFEAALGPVSQLRQKRRVIVVPDGPLDSVGFESLVNERGQYLVRSHTISYVPSATVLHILRNRTRNLTAPYTILAFGAPEAAYQLASARPNDAGATRGLLDINGGSITRLRSASGEIRVISSELGGTSQVLLGPDATEARFKSEPLKQFRVIHFATHAFADLHHPERSAIVLAPDARTGDDGLLQIREIRNLRLHADLVTLSTCDAGAGRPEGIQGLESLVNAFQFAGARSVLASRWATDDTFAASLMTGVYRELGTGTPAADALRRAQLAALERFGSAARPSLWSAFFVSGEPNTTINGKSLQAERR